MTKQKPMSIRYGDTVQIKTPRFECVGVVQCADWNDNAGWYINLKEAPSVPAPGIWKQAEHGGTVKVIKKSTELTGYEAARKTAFERLKRSQELDSKYDYDYSDDVKKERLRMRELQGLWNRFGKLQFVRQMDEQVRDVVDHYHEDFYYHDLKIIEQYHGRFAWLVGDCGTHFIKLEVTPDGVDSAKAMLEAVQKSEYGRRYRLYIVDQNRDQISPVTWGQIELKVVEEPRETHIA